MFARTRTAAAAAGALVRAARSPLGAERAWGSFGALAGRRAGVECASSSSSMRFCAREYSSAIRARMVGWAHASRRGFASDGVKSERTLTEALLEEHAHESAAYEPSETATAGPPAPFELHETKGDAEVTLTRKFGDNDAEEVTVTFIAQEDPYEEDDFDDEDFDIDAEAEDGTTEDDDVDGLNDDEDAITISFNVVVSKTDGSAYLDFDCLTDGEIIEIRHVGFEAFDEENPVIGTTYSGPNFEDLEESVQDKFHDYLEERGINADLANYIIEAHLDKEQREYTSWLERVAHFVKK